MPSYHGRQIRSAGLRMFSRSCSGRIVGNSEVNHTLEICGFVMYRKVGIWEVIAIAPGYRRGLTGNWPTTRTPRNLARLGLLVRVEVPSEIVRMPFSKSRPKKG